LLEFEEEGSEEFRSCAEVSMLKRVKLLFIPGFEVEFVYREMDAKQVG